MGTMRQSGNDKARAHPWADWIETVPCSRVRGRAGLSKNSLRRFISHAHARVDVLKVETVGIEYGNAHRCWQPKAERRNLTREDVLRLLMLPRPARVETVNVASKVSA